MKRPAVFFDRDNTLIVSDGYLGDPAKVQLIPGAADAIARARQLGYAVVIFSNQSGVARGMFSEEDVQAVNARMEQMLLAENPGATVDRHEYCPFHPDGTIDVYARESDRRKPRPGMILSAARVLDLDVEQSWVIGDAGRDVEAGKAVGCRTILFTDPTLTKSPAAEATPAVAPDYTVASLIEAMDLVERNAPATSQPVSPVASQAAAVAQRAPEEPTPAVTVAPPAESPQPAPHHAPEPAPAAAEPPPARVEEPAPAKRVPKVAIGSKYVPPEGKESTFIPPTREDFESPAPPPASTAAAERPAPRKAAAVVAAMMAAKRAESTSPPAADNEPAPARTNRPAVTDLPPTGFERMEEQLEQIFLELRRQHEQPDADFSISKLLAGVVQVLVLAVMFLAYVKRPEILHLHTYLLVASVLQTLTISLLIMSRQK
jgi:histidinol-phosphate phosphatase family protein